MNDEVVGGLWQSTEAKQHTGEPERAKRVPSGLKFRAPNWGQKAVLLVDANARTRDSRAKILRKLGAVVDCVSGPETAMSRFGSSFYNLVLIDLKRDVDSAEQLANAIRANNPRQLVAFLVGSPLFVAKSLKRDGAELKRVSAPPSTRPDEKTHTPVADVFDFGQKIRDAEAKVVA
jgi:CheY-like chemotaxis protein